MLRKMHMQIRKANKKTSLFFKDAPTSQEAEYGLKGEKKMDYSAIGFVVGAMVGIVIVIALIKMCNKNGAFKTEYDERQEAIRGRGYKYTVYITWALMALSVLLDSVGIVIPMDYAAKMFTIILLSVMVSVSYFIWNEAYFGQNNSIRKYGIAFTIIALFNLVITIFEGIRGGLVEEGILTFKAVNLEIVIMFAIIGIEYLIKKLVTKPEED